MTEDKQNNSTLIMLVAMMIILGIFAYNETKKDIKNINEKITKLEYELNS